ncbi:chemotaxis protein CheD [Prosthecochloris sp. CIB 2401]|uniref:chemotaxis protein CheD n=1 Tax=Prosthecochloris sp. CIB 2401 TaxID=1868325 RepID=UPI00080AAA7D|nr:chemotaxis protein CheD [Prosthecochloris sp. CIB 2401]ANT64935.1 Chemoreceptor glutamine deamidase CheD [Prosthecochloris sp. CIB 2401]
MPDRESFFVSTGQVVTGTGNTILESSPLGSCIAVCAIDHASSAGGMAHIMLPGKSPYENAHNKYRYAADALQELVACLQSVGCDLARMKTCLIGGANVLKREKDTIHTDNLKSITKLLSQMQIKVHESCTGGFERRTALMDITEGRIFVAIGSQPQRQLLDCSNVAARKTD